MQLVERKFHHFIQTIPKDLTDNKSAFCSDNGPVPNIYDNRIILIEMLFLGV